MNTYPFFLFFLCFAPLIVANSHQQDVSRSQFPDEFLFGAATSSYQIEGAVLEGGKGLNTWDIYVHKQGTIQDGQNADVADDHYHRYEEDIELMHTLGITSYRFSISWSRILPRGRFGEVNLDGINFYNNLIDGLLLKGIQPFVTLFHFDIPHELEVRYESWLSPLIQEDFAYFAEICFKNFGDRVKYWTTINEPNNVVFGSYIVGQMPPARCSAPFGNCSAGNSELEPLIATHNMILSHIKATEIYRKHYQAKQGGYIGIVLKAVMYIPYSDSEADREAATRAMAYNNAWFLDPIIRGDYPQEVKRYLGVRLPKFSREESNKLKDGLDFIGINHYATLYAKDCIHSPCDSSSSSTIMGLFHETGLRDGVPIGEPTPLPWFFVVPDGLEKIISYFKIRYNNKPIIVTENGITQKDEPLKPRIETINDFKRVEYHKLYLASLARAISNGADVRGYFVWSLMDNFEWSHGYTMRFGLYYVDYQTLERIPKLSAKWYQTFLANGTNIGEGKISSITPYNQDKLYAYQ